MSLSKHDGAWHARAMPERSPILAPVVVIAGPTASGKSGLAVAVARAFGGVIVNADAIQVYAELRILTARPGPQALAAAPHRLYGYLPAAERGSVGRWRDLAAGELAALHRAGHLPIVVGGTGLYLRALMRGLSPVPEIPSAVRAAGVARLEALGSAALHGELAARDPAMAARLAPGDRQRVLRAWEVMEATGRSLAFWQQRRIERTGGWRFLSLLLLPPRPALYASCNDRVLAMLDAGALDEARAMAALRLDPSLPAMKAVGLRELMGQAAGEQEPLAALAAAQQKTRRYAKRQLTWFRQQLPEAEVIKDMAKSAQESERLAERVFPIIRAFLLTH